MSIQVKRIRLDAPPSLACAACNSGRDPGAAPYRARPRHATEPDFMQDTTATNLSWFNPRSTQYAWLIVALLVPVALLNYLDRQMLAAMKFSVMNDIPGIGSEANWGKILALFKWTYA